MKGLFRKGCLAVGAVLALGAVAPALASADTSIPCSAQTFSQAFSAWNDLNWYTPVGGETADNVNGAGWTLSGGATLVSTTLRDGTAGQVLNLPGGATAVTPPICIDQMYPTARTMDKELNGSSGVHLSIAYALGGVWQAQAVAGYIAGGVAWGPSGRLALPVNLLAGSVPARFTFTAAAGRGATQIYDFYVDPRLRH